MENSSCYSLQRTMVIYLLLIGIAALFVGMEFVIDTNSATLRVDLLANFEQYSRQEIGVDEIFQPIEKLRNKAMVMVAVILCVVVVVLTMFIKHITEPLQHMIVMARKIAAGDLSRTITIESRNELMELGNVINEMSSNLQEILLLAKKFCFSGETVITNMAKVVKEKELGAKDGEVVQKGLETLQEDLTKFTLVLDYFNFYTLEKNNDD